MIKYFLILVFAVFFLGSTTAQNFINSEVLPIRSVVNINPYPDDEPVSGTLNDTLRILAVMVSFQEDKDQATVGNGKFESIYSQNYGNKIIDPLPHDRAYFEAHLEFVKNYFAKVSNGKQNILYHVLPDTFSVSKTMRNYSPEPGSEDFTPIGLFAEEVWGLADQLYPGFDFSSYDLFLIFHAGVGRDVILPGSLGNERDLPSVYMSQRAFRNVFGETFNGFPVSGGAFKITNSIIMPQTQNREVSTFGGTFLFQITINGLLAASIASHLGLPDLFNTETGLSAIGRFGLMDGQAIFAYNGVFPPEPSAWEKIYLGWAEPVTITPGNYEISLVTKLAAGIPDTVILKIPISSKEYFLIENRIRDANANGAIVTYILSGDTLTKTFPKDTTGFLSYSVDSLRGVITNIDEFDWALPGNGIVIWHIDENVIDANFAANTINNDKFNRGVAVKEADGVQDIGERFRTIFGDFIVGEGTELDFWYASNPAELYKNRFSKDTRPSSNSNSGANSLITISDFSDIANRMSFKVSYGDSVIVPIFSNQLQIDPAGDKSLTALSHINGSSFGLISNKNLYRLDSKGVLSATILNFSDFKPASFYWNNTEYFAGARLNNLNVYLTDGIVIYADGITLPQGITAPPVVRLTPTEQRQILAGTEKGKIYIISPGALPANAPEIMDSISISPALAVIKIASSGFYTAFITDPGTEADPLELTPLYFDTDGNQYGFKDERPVDLILTTNSKSEKISLVLTNQNNIYIISGSKLINKIELNRSTVVSSFIVSDLKSDGENYIVIAHGDKIDAFNLSGGRADNFPFTDPLGKIFSQAIISADFEGDFKAEIIASTEDGRIFAIDGGSGKIVYGYPLTTGSSIRTVPVLFELNKKASLAVLNEQNNFSAWHIGLTEGKFIWSEENGNPFSNSFVEKAAGFSSISEFFPKSRVYNYPNPVYDSHTTIRYYVSEDSRISIKIFDLAGDLVAEINDNAQGGFDNETVWNVSNVQSGVYLARIEAAGSGGKTESNVIKIAVVK